MSDNVVRTFVDGEEVRVVFTDDTRQEDHFYLRGIRWLSSEEVEDIRNNAPVPTDFQRVAQGEWINCRHTTISGSFEQYEEEVKLIDNKYKMTRYLKMYYNYLKKLLEEEGMNVDIEDTELVLCFMQDYIYYDEELTDEQIRRINIEYDIWKSIKYLNNLD